MRRLPCNRRVRIALRRPSEWRGWRIRVEGVLANSLSAEEVQAAMRKAWRDLLVFGSSSHIVLTGPSVDVERMRQALDMPQRKWFRLTQGER